MLNDELKPLEAAELSIEGEEEELDSVVGGFAGLGLPEPLVEAVAAAGYEHPTPIQEKAIPVAMGGSDIIGVAQTGSGKTAAYVLAALARAKLDKSVEILTLVPTRELAGQVASEFRRLGQELGIRAVTVVGGESLSRQVELVNRGCEVIVATPGRLLDQLSAGRFKRFAPHVVVFDEADEMLDMGFADEIEAIGAHLPKQRQSLLFSATLSKPIKRLIDAMLEAPIYLQIEADESQAPKIEQELYVVPESERVATLVRLLQHIEAPKAMVFCRTRVDAETLHQEVLTAGMKTAAIHGDMSQGARNAAIRALRDGSIDILVATDVASRGLDVEGLTHVINYHLPDNGERYIHRIGRTGRAGKEGTAITIANPAELRGHRLFRHLRIDSFTVRSVPRRQVVQDQWNQALLDKICATPVAPAARQVCEELYDSEFGFDIMCSMLSMLQASRRVDGPEELGLTPEAVNRLSSGKGIVAGKKSADRRPHHKRGRGFQRRGKRRAR